MISSAVSLKQLFFVLVAIQVIILIYVLDTASCQHDDDLNNELEAGSCDTQPATIHVTKEELDETGAVVRICEGDIQVNKCEGTCTSQLKPSVASHSGFHKQCFCCRETWMKQRKILLTDCFTADGTRLEEEGLNNMQIPMQEPEGCKCHKCGV